MPQKPSTWRNIFVWSYERGTLPYDILCGLILAFVFFVPRSCFAPKKVENPAVRLNADKVFASQTTLPSPVRQVPAKRD
jgi:hypothetical protein